MEKDLKMKVQHRNKTSLVFCALFLTFITSGLTACGSVTMPMLRAKAKTGSFSSMEMNDGFKNYVKKANEFALPLIENIHKDEKLNNKNNVAYSPASLFYATSMLSRIVSNKDKENLLNILNMSEDEIKCYAPSLYRACNIEFGDRKILGKERMDNSIWLDSEHEFDSTLLDDIANIFYTDSFSCDFFNNNEKVNQAISDYVKDCTEGYLVPEYHFDPTTAFVLLNTLYFEDIWNFEGEDLRKDKNRPFYNYDNSVTNSDFYLTDYVTAKIIETDRYQSMYALTYNHFKIDFIVPKDGVSVEELFNVETLSEHESMSYVGYEYENDEEIIYLGNISTPEFDGSFHNDIIQNFYEAYQLDLIDDFSEFSPESSLEVATLIHSTKVEFRKDKVKGAAATAFGGNDSACAPKKEVYETLIVDRPFIYTIKDPQGVNLFQGVVYNIK